jgi:cell wall-associated NlpC family hydrolase
MKLLVVLFLALSSAVFADITRSEAIKIAESFVNHKWTAEQRHVRHGKDTSGIEVHTPDRAGGHASPETQGWTPGKENIGVAYKWGGWDTPEKFDAGLRKGRAAGDVYSAEKRRKGGAAVSGDCVGVDCSGFVSRCWGLKTRESTSTLSRVSKRLSSAAELQPGDVMNTAGAHVILFVRWLDSGKKRALFYEAAPFSKARSIEHDIADLTAGGFVPLRYRGIRE